MHDLEKKLGIQFCQIHYLTEALTHASFDKGKGHHNERLEFFGDAVLKLVISDYLFHQYPQEDEGQLTKRRATLVSDQLLWMMACDLNLGQYLNLSTSEIKQGGRERQSILANAFEALLGAIYLDQGLAVVKTVLISLLETCVMPKLSSELLDDAKTMLQEKMQKQGVGLPIYRLVRTEGKEHEKVFITAVDVIWDDRKITGIGKGQTKKESEQVAARNVLTKLKGH